MGACKSLLGDNEFEFCNTPIELRNESYRKVLPDIGARQKLVFDCLKSFPNGATAREIMHELYMAGKINNDYELNQVRPRLTELKDDYKLIEVIKDNKKYDAISKSTVSIFTIRKEDFNPHELF
jgi:hypothetical protein